MSSDFNMGFEAGLRSCRQQMQPRIDQLLRDHDRLVGQLDEARKAARSIYKSHLTGEFFMDEIANAALAHWQWLEETT